MPNFANNRPVMIIYRDRHGRRCRIDFANASRAAISLRNGDLDDASRAAISLRNGDLDDARRILAVYEDGLCLYSSLASDKVINIPELRNFFEPEITQ